MYPPSSRSRPSSRCSLPPRGRQTPAGARSRPSRKTVLAVLLCLGALSGCAVLNPRPPGPPPDPAAQMPALEARILTMVEDERMKIDPQARRLALDPELTKIARERAKDMAAKHYLAHVSPNGQTSATLLMAQDADFQGLLGENLAAQHYTPQLGIPVDVFAKRFLDTWLDSPPHKENLAFKDYDHAGVGAAVNGDTVYVALLFTTDLGLPSHGKVGAQSSGKSIVTRFDTPQAARAAKPKQSAPIRLRGAVGVSPADPG